MGGGSEGGVVGMAICHIIGGGVMTHEWGLVGAGQVSSC